MSKEKPILSVRIDPAIMQRIDRLVERTGVGRAEIVERCLSVGLVDEEEFCQWLISPIKGPLAELLTHPRVIATLFGKDAVDETQQKVRANLKLSRKGRKGGKYEPSV